MLEHVRSLYPELFCYRTHRGVCLGLRSLAAGWLVDWLIGFPPKVNADQYSNQLIALLVGCHFMLGLALSFCCITKLWKLPYADHIHQLYSPNKFDDRTLTKNMRMAYTHTHARTHPHTHTQTHTNTHRHTHRHTQTPAPWSGMNHSFKVQLFAHRGIRSVVLLSHPSSSCLPGASCC